jgi:antitoxin component of MazEF toxin-antitoxin module
LYAPDNADRNTQLWESFMKVAKWGNALAIRLPIAVVRELGLKEGDQVDIRVSGERAFVVAREPRPIDSHANARSSLPSR